MISRAVYSVVVLLALACFQPRASLVAASLLPHVASYTTNHSCPLGFNDTLGAFNFDAMRSADELEVFV